MLNRFIYLFVWFGLLWSCDEATINPDENRLGLEYFPLETGRYSVYDVQEVNYSILGSDTSNYQLRQSVVDSFLNAENNFTYILNREVRTSDNEQWSLDSVWTARRSTSIGVVNENNVAFIKLVFPIENDLTWDGNKLNKNVSEQYRYDLELADTTVFNTEYKNVVRVIQSDVPENLVNRDERQEIYCLLYTSPSPRDLSTSRMPSSA